MTTRHGDPRFYQLIEEVSELHSRKNFDYCPSHKPLHNFRRCGVMGVEPWKGILVRMSDKWSRIEQLSNGKTPKNESLRDSLIDNAVYSLLCIILLDEAAQPEPVQDSRIQNTQSGQEPAPSRQDASAHLSEPEAQFVNEHDWQGALSMLP